MIIVAVAVGAGAANQKSGNRYVSVIVGLISIIYYFFSGASENKWFFPIAAVLIIIISVVFGLMRTIGSMVDKYAYIAQFAIFWIQIFQFWSYIFLIYPAEQFWRFWKGPADYKSGVKGQGFSIWWWSLVSLIVVVAISSGAGYMRVIRDKKMSANVNKNLL